MLHPSASHGSRRVVSLSKSHPEVTWSHCRGKTPSALAFSITAVGIWKERSKTKHTKLNCISLHTETITRWVRACAKQRAASFSRRSMHSTNFPIHWYYHRYTTTHGDPDSKRQAREKWKENNFLLDWLECLETLQRQAEWGIRYFTFKEQTLLNKAEKEGECRYLIKLDINVLIGYQC